MVKPSKKTAPAPIADSTGQLDATALKKPTRSAPKVKPAEDHNFNLPNVRHFSTSQKLLSVGLFSLLILGIGLFSLRVAYAQRLYPGVWGNGIYLGGLTKAEAKKLLDEQTTKYVDTPLFIASGPNNTKLDLHSIDLTYANQALVDELFAQGRSGNIADQLSRQVVLIIGGSDKDASQVNYSGEKLSGMLDEQYDKSATAVTNASFDYADGSLKVEPGKSGQRLDLGSLVLALDNHFRTLDIKQIQATTIAVSPLIDNETIATNKADIESYVAKPLKLTSENKSWDIGPKEMIGWLKYPGAINTVATNTPLMLSFYRPPGSVAKFGFDKTEIKGYLSGLAGQINVEAQDAQLTIEGDRATVFKQSRDGKKLDVDKSTEAVYTSLTGSNNANRTVALNVSVTKAAVNDQNINNLGIKELLSEGVSYFPGSSSARLTNVRVGSAKFNGVLLKPGETFSFGALLGDVGPEQGYAKSYVILDGKQGTDYGGGLCQVSSTAYRAALLAGLPIVERHNHAFAVSFYTEPFGVPGVDATIYYPQVDMKFKNDTGAHILIQTEMKGTTLKFRFYGTKTKSGVIRGPQFISGNSDPNQPSHTVFYRDVMVNGAVTKTDTINTYYKSALDYPHVD